MAAQQRYMYKYNYTVNSLLRDAGQRRTHPQCGFYDTDHIVELQLVVAALNSLPVKVTLAV